jgi:TetR/AcrR family transcriptional regulator, transcriptional repressor for nem operon
LPLFFFIKTGYLCFGEDFSEISPMRQTNVREKLLSAAFECFRAKGYKGTTIEDIADAARVFKGSFYNHFKSKEVLAIEVVNRYEHDLVTASLSLQGPPSPLKRLRKHFESLAKMSEKDEYRHGCLMNNFSAEISDTGKLRRALDQAYIRWFTANAEVIRQAQVKREINANYQADQLARFLCNSWEGATNYMKVVRSRKPLDDFFAITLSSNLLK